LFGGGSAAVANNGTSTVGYRKGTSDPLYAVVTATDVKVSLHIQVDTAAEQTHPVYESDCRFLVKDRIDPEEGFIEPLRSRVGVIN
jgi:hypothetical protein